MEPQNPAPPVEVGRMMVIPVFQGFKRHPRWLFGISSTINSMKHHQKWKWNYKAPGR